MSRGADWIGVLLLLNAVLFGCRGADDDAQARVSSAAETSGNPASSPFSKGGDMSLKDALLNRRSVRSFKPLTLTETQVSDLLYAAQGVTSPRGYRTAPSAGATYPLELHVVARNGVFRYSPVDNRIVELSKENRTNALSGAALGQRSVAQAGANFVFGAVVKRTADKYGDRARRYVDIEAGCAAQNLMLMATSMGLGSVMIGAQDDKTVKDIAMLPKGCDAVVMVAVGLVE